MVIVYSFTKLLFIILKNQNKILSQILKQLEINLTKMRIKPLLICFAIVHTSGPVRNQPPILDLIGHGKFKHGSEGGCSPPEISQGIKLFDEVNKDCEHFGKFFFSFEPHLFI